MEVDTIDYGPERLIVRLHADGPIDLGELAEAFPLLSSFSSGIVKAAKGSRVPPIFVSSGAHRERELLRALFARLGVKSA